jgi:DNA oxidative demethylase
VAQATRRRRKTEIERPKGFAYRPEVVSAEDERDLVAMLEALKFDEVRMRGQVAKRTVHHFGFHYDYESYELVPSEPFPPALQALRDRSASIVEDLKPDALDQALVSRYPPGAGIGWHRDAPAFGEPVIGVSLLGVCRMRLQRSAGEERRLFELDLEPRSAYGLTGSSRWAWQHSIPATKELRYSITFRTLKKRRTGD